MDIYKIKLLYHTVKYLKPIQVYYRLYYFIRNILIGKKVKKKTLANFDSIVWKNGFSYENSYLDKDDSFTFLNFSHSFSENIDWNFNQFGKLWTYNLNYFDFLNQKNISKETGLQLIQDFIKKDTLLKDGKEPYPISLRAINWIKYLSNSKVNDELINNSLYNHYCILFKNLEYHLLGNHLLENAFSLLFGAYYFQDEELYNKSNDLLISELNEQVLKDGAHFELSPMYHQIILSRLLDSIQLIKLNSIWKKDHLVSFLEKTASLMISWLQNITYRNGKIPMVNDATYDIAQSSAQLFSYAKKLGILNQKIPLSDSGYRKFMSNNYELFIDVGNVGAEYQPAHAHSDTFNFEFLYKGRPIIVDTGISSYEKNSSRQLERSTESHNTIRVDGKDSSEVWGGFRVARRAKIISFKEDENNIVATHDGYKRIGAFHTRSFYKLSQKLIIKDFIDSKRTHQIESFLHFHPDCNISVVENKIMVDSEITITFKNHRNLIVQEYDFPLGYNRTKKACKIRTLTEKESKIEIAYEN